MLRLEITDLSAEGHARFQVDFENTVRRDGGKTSRTDFALGWMACAARFGIRHVFADEAQARIWPARPTGASDETR